MKRLIPLFLLGFVAFASADEFTSTDWEDDVGLKQQQINAEAYAQGNDQKQVTIRADQTMILPPGSYVFLTINSFLTFTTPQNQVVYTVMRAPFSIISPVELKNTAATDCKLGYQPVFSERGIGLTKEIIANAGFYTILMEVPGPWIIRNDNAVTGSLPLFQGLNPMLLNFPVPVGSLQAHYSVSATL